MRPLTRRAALTGTTAIAATTALGVGVAETNSLPSLLAEHKRVERAYTDAQETADEALFTTRDAYPKVPRSLIARCSGRDGVMRLRPWTRDWAENCHARQLTTWGGTKHEPQIEAKFSKIFAELDAHEAQCEALLAEAGHPRLEARAQDLGDRHDDVLNALISTRATTPAGMLAKLRLAVEHESFAEHAADPDDRLVAARALMSLMYDLMDLVGDPGTRPFVTPIPYLRLADA